MRALHRRIFLIEDFDLRVLVLAKQKITEKGVKSMSMFNFGIKQTYEARWEPQWLRVSYSDGREGWLWRNLQAFDAERAAWIALEPLNDTIHTQNP